MAKLRLLVFGTNSKEPAPVGRGPHPSERIPKSIWATGFFWLGNMSLICRNRLYKRDESPMSDSRDLWKQSTIMNKSPTACRVESFRYTHLWVMGRVAYILVVVCNPCCWPNWSFGKWSCQWTIDAHLWPIDVAYMGQLTNHISPSKRSVVPKGPVFTILWAKSYLCTIGHLNH